MRKRFTTILVALILLTGLTNAQVVVSGSIDSDVTWSSDNTYILDGLVFVEDGAALTIEAGTVVKAETGTGENASALIIKRGGQIFANGTETEPIIFTSIQDVDLDLNSDFKGLWGGLIILGKGPHNNPSNDNGIEGVPVDANANYGGDDAQDNSGVLKFVSIRHGGSELAPDEEINGLTLGAVGAGTEIHHVEVFANDDDGVEWFGGNVNTKFMVVTDCGDDSYDMDEGFTGLGQFWFTKQTGDGTGDNFGEHDGGPSNNRWGAPFTTPVVSNATYVGGGATAGDRSLTLREFFGGSYYNSIFAEQAKGIRVEYVPEFDDAGELGGAFSQWNTWDNMKIENNIFQNIGDGSFASVATVYSPEDDNDQPIYDVPQDSIDAFVSYIESNNAIADVGVTAAAPVPTGDVSSPVYTGLDDWFDQTAFKGAFNPAVSGHWAGGWSKTFADDTYNDEIITGIFDNKYRIISANVYPNPVTSHATVTFDNDNSQSFTFTVYGIDGRTVKQINDIRTNRFEFSRESMKTGIYIYELRNEASTEITTGKMIVK